PGSGTPTGTVTFSDGNPADNRTVPLSGGQATADFTGLASGTGVTITATYNGDNNFVSSVGSAGATPSFRAMVLLASQGPSSTSSGTAQRSNQPTAQSMAPSRVDSFFASAPTKSLLQLPAPHLRRPMPVSATLEL